MAQVLLGQFLLGAVSSIAGTLVLEAGKDIKSQGLQWYLDDQNQNQIEARFATDISSLNLGQGALYGFATYRAPDGQSYAVGPVPFGIGSAPENPLIDIEFSDRAARGLSAGLAEKLQPAAGWEDAGYTYYWAARLPDGKVAFYRADAGAIEQKSRNEILRIRSRAARASQGPAITKLSEQARLFDEIENRFRDDFRSAEVEAQLLAARQKMRRSDALFREATARQQAALERARKAQGIQDAMALFNLAAGMTGLIANAQAEADYHKTSGQNAGTQYNIHVETYLIIIRENTPASGGILPSNPKIPLP